MLQGPPPTEPLLRSAGGDGPPPASLESAHRASIPAFNAAAILAGDAASILATVPRRAAVERWTARSFIEQVAAVRRHLAPFSDPDLLASSFGREAFHGPGIEPVPAVPASPVRVAYAIRWIELRAGLDLPAWPLWVAS